MPNNKLSPEEVSLIRGILLYYPEIKSQEIQSWFFTPGRFINSGRFSEIKNGHSRYAHVQPCTNAQADEFVRKAQNALASAQPMAQLRLPGMEGIDIPRTESCFGGVLEVEIGASVARVLTQESAGTEFKQFYEKSSVSVYIKTLSGMLNSGNPGGIVFGVSDDGAIVGVSGSVPEDPFHRAIKAFFDPFYRVGVKRGQVGGKQMFYVKTTTLPEIPVICRKQKVADDKTILEEGAIYYRYGSNTEKIKHAELRSMIDAKVDAEVKRRLSLLP